MVYIQQIRFFLTQETFSLILGFVIHAILLSCGVVMLTTLVSSSGDVSPCELAFTCCSTIVAISVSSRLKDTVVDGT